MAEAERAESTTGRRRAPARARPAHAVLTALVLLTAACGGAPSADGSAATLGAPGTAERGTTATETSTSTADAAEAGTDAAGTGPGPESSAVRSVVEGFPVDLLPLPEDAMILVTSAVPVGDSEVQEVSLNLRTRVAPAEVLALYRESLTGAGFTELPAEAPHDELAAEATFVRSGGDELVSVGVLDDDGLRSVTIGGRLRTEQ